MLPTVNHNNISGNILLPIVLLLHVSA